MLVFIDESGDPGMPPGNGASEFFTVTLADVVCVAVARSYTAPQENNLYRKLISHREMQVQFWPK